MGARRWTDDILFRLLPMGEAIGNRRPRNPSVLDRLTSHSMLPHLHVDRPASPIRALLANLG